MSKTWRVVLTIKDDGATAEQQREADVERYLVKQEIKDALTNDLPAGLDVEFESMEEVKG